MRNPTERKKRLHRILAALPGRPVWLAEYGPGDGRTRYTLVSGSPDYFGGQRIAWAEGLAEAERMVEAYVAGRRDGWEDRESDAEESFLLTDRDFRREVEAPDERTALRAALDLAEEVVRAAGWRTEGLARVAAEARNGFDGWDLLTNFRKDARQVLRQLVEAIREDYLPGRWIGWDGKVLFVRDGEGDR